MFDCLFSLFFALEDIQDHHDEEGRNGYAEQDAEQHLADEADAERLKEKQREMVDEHHHECVTQEPYSAKLPDVRLWDVLELLVARNELDDRGAAKRHQGGGAGMKTGRASKQVDAQAQGKAQNQKLPFGCAERQQHDEYQVDIRMYITS